MRSSKSRSRSKANRPRTLGNIVNRVFDSSGPEGKVRGTPAQIIEKYQFLARDAQLSNDRVGAENFLQHAEHYTRMLAEAMREMQAEQDARQQYAQPGQGGQGGQNNPNYQGGNGGNGGGNQGGYAGGNRDGNQNGNRDGNQNGNRDGNRDGQRDNRYEPRRDDRYDRSNDTGSGLGPVIGADDDSETGPVPTPEAAVAEPRFERNQRQDNQRSDNQRQDREPREPREPRYTPPAAAQGAEAPAPEQNQPRRAPRPYPPRVRPALEDQPGLPSFITDPIAVPAVEPVAAATPAEKPKAAPRPRKPAAPKVAAETAEPKSGA